MRQTKKCLQLVILPNMPQTYVVDVKKKNEHLFSYPNALHMNWSCLLTREESFRKFHKRKPPKILFPRSTWGELRNYGRNRISLRENGKKIMM